MSGRYIVANFRVCSQFNRFTSVTDRFLAELGHGQVLKDLDMRYEKLIRGLKHIQIKVHAYFLCVL